MSDIAEFDPNKKIIEYQFSQRVGPLASMSVKKFADETSMESPAPGGGSVAALAGSMGAALIAMVANLTIGKKGYEAVSEELKEVALQAQNLKDELLRAIDRDTEAFNSVMDACRLPKKNDEQKAQRENAIQEATKQAALVPLQVMKVTESVLGQAQIIAEKGIDRAASDAGVAALMARACGEGAYLNVKINLKGIEDKEFNEKTLTDAERLLTLIRISERNVLDIVEKRMTDENQLL